MTTHPRRPHRLCLATPFALGLAVLLVLSGCGAADGADGGTINPTSGSDTSVSDTSFDTSATSGTDTASDTGSGTDTNSDASDTTSGDTRETVASAALKDNDGVFIVPTGIAERTSVTVSGDLVMWVERDDPDSEPRLTLWNPLTLDVDPVSYRVPNLKNPTDLVFDEGLAVYVDDRYGDPDIFALDLLTGRERVVVSRPGTQAKPALLGSLVAWEECRGCVTGSDDSSYEILTRNLDGGVETLITDDTTADRRPVFGTLADGSPGLAWVSGLSVLRTVSVNDSSTSAAWDVGGPVGGVALAEGVLAWRASPFIINPDSMRPTDVFFTDVASGETIPITLHAELGLTLPVPPMAGGGLVAWLTSTQAAPNRTQIDVYRAAAASSLAEAAVDAPVSSFSLSLTTLAVTAPRSDNDEMSDVWVWLLP